MTTPNRNTYQKKNVSQIPAGTLTGIIIAIVVVIFLVGLLGVVRQQRQKRKIIQEIN